MRDRLLRKIPQRNIQFRKNNPYWTIEKIKEGFNKFYLEKGYYPTQTEIDNCDYLPSSRQILRSFGGLKKLRELLGLDITDFTKGETRSSSAKLIGKRGKQWEQTVEEGLVNHFGEVFVHRDKFINIVNIKPDFVVYAKNKTFAVDVFFPAYMHSLIGSVNSKERVYKKLDLSLNIYFVYVNSEIDTQEIELFLQRKVRQLQQNYRLLSLVEFLEAIKLIEPLVKPLNYKPFYKKA
ncbi:MAG: hypothetical protein A3A97_01810 [Candidatus Terrybacteria bacterium RIFCSPLOWO2_01_FULL_40_23]|uniref:Uncharacterized protein n=1 Tax=Candidatus Terrybacteria bacterium RIFCSPLOWO2_01_FULL_40_23 TaxID=1802366 RepID=A0A1G2PUD7_9BACT|nr:MAG: hypothetical protein A3A97_01810 [Candidatus Terrybacteria bacterium RIFCSPLOWO2_01_FULL_40_23]